MENKTVPLFSKYEMGQLCYLLWEVDNNNPLEEVRKALFLGMFKADVMATQLVDNGALSKKQSAELLELFQAPLEKMPLFLNGKRHQKFIAKWRLSIGV